jgi:hypothetical protein
MPDPNGNVGGYAVFWTLIIHETVLSSGIKD